MDWQESAQQWKELHPNWEYHFTTDEDNRNYVELYFPQYLNTYDNLPYPIQRADMIRYMYLYNMGGVYSDLDIIPIRPLTDYNFDSQADVYVCCSGNTPSVFTNSLIISKPNCQIWLDMLEHIKAYKKWFFTIRHIEIMNSTGPLGFTKIARKHIKSINVLPSKLFMPCSSADTNSTSKQKALQQGAYNYPVKGNSWHSWDSKLLHDISTKKNIYFVIVGMVVILGFIFTRAV